MATIKHLQNKYAIAKYELIVACDPLELKFYLWLKMWAINKSSAWPSYRVIQADLGITAPTIKKLIDDMEKKGRLKITRGDTNTSNIYDITWYDSFSSEQSKETGVLKKLKHPTKETLVRGTKETLAERIIIKQEGINYITEQSSEGKDINLVIDSFKEINPAYQKWFARPPMRETIRRLLDRHGLDRVLKVIMILPKTNKIPYLPSITTPLQLEDRWASLEAGLTKEKNKKLQTGRGIA